MPLPAPRRPLLAALLGGALGAAAVLPAVGAGAPPEAQPVRVVASVTGSLPALEGVRVVQELPAVGAVVVEATRTGLARLAAARAVRGVTPDVPMQLTGRPSDGSGVPAAQGLGGTAGRAGAGAGTRIAVVDTGVSDTRALDRASGRLVDAWSFDAETDDDGVYDDGYGHGTFMATVAAGGPAAGSGGRPVGVAPGATVLVVRVADGTGTTSLSQVLGGLAWVVDHADEVDVANLSLSHTRPGTAYGADPLVDAVRHVRAAGVVAVVSAGNDPSLVGDPGFAPEALTVGAADLTLRQPAVAPFSGSDDVAGVRKPDVVASGVNVLGVLPAGSLVASTHSPVVGELWRGSGTSQAAAVTSGVAALHLAHRPDATPQQVKAALRTAARDLSGGRDGAGLLRATGAPGRTGADGPPLAEGSDPTGEAGFDANSWSANSWSANSWSANSWSANSWSANSWSANSWSSTWGAGR